MTEYGDIRDVLAGLPFPPDDGLAYAYSDLFVVRHEIIRALDPQPRSVFEFGALRGFFLVTALDAVPSMTRVGWVDDETHTPGSNEMCYRNTRAVIEAQPRREVEAWVGRNRDELPYTQQWWPFKFDLVQVDANHSYAETLADLNAAVRLDPRWVFVDDWTAEMHRDSIQRAVHHWQAAERDRGADWELAEHVTVNGLAVFTRRT